MIFQKAIFLLTILLSFQVSAVDWYEKPDKQNNILGLEQVFSEKGIYVQIYNKDEKKPIKLYPSDGLSLDTDTSFVWEFKKKKYFVAVWIRGQRSRLVEIYDLQSHSNKSIYSLDSASEPFIEKSASSLRFIYSNISDSGLEERDQSAIWSPL